MKMRFYYTAALLFFFAFTSLFAENDRPKTKFAFYPTEKEFEEALPPLECDAFYFVTGAGRFGRYDENGNEVLIANTGLELNGAGFNDQDGFVYAFNTNTRDLIRFHDDGTFDNLGNLGLPNALNPFCSSFDSNGNLYVTGGVATIYRIDVQNLTFTPLFPNQAFPTFDWAYHPGFQTFYGAGGGQLWSYNPATNNVSSTPLTGISNSSFAAAFYGANGYIYVAGGAGTQVYKIDVQTLEAQQIGTIPFTQGLDGASCQNALPPWPFICAEDDEGCAAEGSASLIPVKDNDIPNNTLISTATITIIIPPQFGTITFDPLTGQPEYTPNGPPMMDQFEYQICPVGFFNGCDRATVNIIPADEELTFDDIGPFCAGDPLFTLPSQSLEGISGTWTLTATGTPSPFVFPAFPGNTSYTFVPENPPGICYQAYEVEVVVAPSEDPEFSIPTQYCQGDAVPALPDMSDNMVSGTWDPATINNQVSRTYTFTPDPIFFPCSPTFELDVTVDEQADPEFSFATSYCTGGAVDALPTTSDDGISGTWAPAAIDNQASGTYIFTPDASECAAEVSIDVTIGSNVNPTFDLLTEYCTGATPQALPTTSDNGITGTWDPATIDNQNDGTYTFTPGGGQCGDPFVLDVTVSSNIIAAFDFDLAYCAGETVDVLPTESNNGIEGSWAPATIDNQASGTYTFTPNADECSDPDDFDVTITPVVDSDFSLLDAYCAGETAEALPTTSDNGVPGSWAPATIDNQTSGNYTFTPADGECANAFVLDVTISPVESPTFSLTNDYCQGEVTDALPNMSDNGLAGTWDATEIDNQASATYTFTPDPSLCANTFELDVTINPTQTPAFTLTDTYCQGATTEALPTTDNNGVTGSWNVAAIDNQASATYTFTPDDGQCGVEFSIDITIDEPEAPAFDLLGGYCEGATTQALPATSDNGIDGSWSPANIDNTTSGTYTFTPDASQCAQSFQLDVDILQPTVSAFGALTDTYCQNATTDALPLISDNGVNGTWSPATVDNQASATYTFTPDAGQCADGFTFDVTIDIPDDPTFSLTDVYCQGATTVALPGTSDNGIIGSWSSATIDNQTSQVYTFTPDAAFCANAFDLDVTINPTVTPDFALQDEYCQGETTVALPATSPNGLTGSWSSPTIDNQTSQVYTFTPNDASQCGVEFDLDVTINPTQTPDFDLQDTYCQDDMTATLPGTSPNGLTGSWAPAVIDNQSSDTYVFTPDNGQCAVGFDLGVTVNPTQNPSFVIDDEYCQGEATELLPTNSDNGVSGSWSPASIDNQASSTYTFTPDDGQCGTVATLDVTINPSLIPTFTLTDSYCQDAATDLLPNTSDNNLGGTWSPAVIDNQASGSYLFTPDPLAQCVSPITLDVTINNPPVLMLEQTEIVDCFDNETAAISLDIQGSGGYTITWNDPALDGEQNPTGLGADTYEVTVVDQFNCTSASSIEITQPTALSLDCQVAVTATPNNADGVIRADYSGGVGPYEISWTGPVDGSANSADPSFDISGMPAGDYEITIRDQNGCTINCTSSIADIPCDVAASLTGEDPSCAGTNDGSVNLDASSSFGIEIIDWNDNTLDGLQNANTLAGGTYDVIVTDSVGCATTTSITLTAPLPEVPVFDLNLTYCPDEPADPLPLTSQNGIPGSWSPAVIDEQNSSTYTFTPDGDVCAERVQVDVEIVEIDAAIRFTGSDCDTDNGTYNINFQVDGDVTGLSVSAGQFQAENLGSNRYIVRDVPAGVVVQGRLESEELCVEEIDFPLPSCFCVNVGGVQIAGPEQVMITQSDSVALTYTTNLRPIETDTIFWTPATGLSCADCLTPWLSADNSTAYELTVVDTTGCRNSLRVNVIVDPSVDVFVPTAFSPNEDGRNDRLTVFAGQNVARIKSFMVFNRWGDIVFNSGSMEPNNPNDGWDGEYRNQPLGQAVFVYVLQVETTDGRDIQLSGETMLLR